MGKYINEDSRGLPIGVTAKTKINSLIADGAIKVSSDKFIPNLVCVVDNGAFGAAAYCYNEKEYQDFKYPDGREKTWLQYENAEKLAK
jgi:hypothetical protein